jgi:hypothetical protein
VNRCVGHELPIARSGAFWFIVALALVGACDVANAHVDDLEGGAVSADAIDIHPSGSDQIATWKVQVLPSGFSFVSAGIFRRISSASDVGITVEVSHTASDADHLEIELPDNARLTWTRDEDGLSVSCLPEWRRWSGIWDSGDDASIRSYWGVRLIFERWAFSTIYNGEREQESFNSKGETKGWRSGMGLILGVSGRVWKALSLSAGLRPLAVTRTIERQVSEDINVSYPSKWEYESDGLDVAFDLEPRLHIVLDW